MNKQTVLLLMALSALGACTVSDAGGAANEVPAAFQGKWVAERSTCAEYQDADNWRHISRNTAEQHEQHCRLIKILSVQEKRFSARWTCTDEDGEAAIQEFGFKLDRSGKRLTNDGGLVYQFCGKD